MREVEHESQVVVVARQLESSSSTQRARQRQRRRRSGDLEQHNPQRSSPLKKLAWSSGDRRRPQCSPNSVTALARELDLASLAQAPCITLPNRALFL